MLVSGRVYRQGVSRGYAQTRIMPNGQFECVVSKAGGMVKRRKLRVLVYLTTCISGRSSLAAPCPAALRSPSATASTSALAASSLARPRRPPSEFLLTFMFPAGSDMVRASDKAEASNRDSAGRILPASAARLNARTSSAPSLNPCPLIMSGTTGKLTAARDSRASPSRHLSQQYQSDGVSPSGAALRATGLSRR